LGNVGVNARTVLKTCLQKWGVRVWTGLSRQCEHGNKPSSSIRGKEFPDKLFKNLIEQNIASETNSCLAGQKMFQPNMEAEGFFSIFPRAFMIHT
jgi:hypothetical protein